MEEKRPCNYLPVPQRFKWCPFKSGAFHQEQSDTLFRGLGGAANATLAWKTEQRAPLHPSGSKDTHTLSCIICTLLDVFELWQQSGNYPDGGNSLRLKWDSMKKTNAAAPAQVCGSRGQFLPPTSYIHIRNLIILVPTTHISSKCSPGCSGREMNLNVFPSRGGVDPDHAGLSHLYQDADKHVCCQPCLSTHECLCWCVWKRCNIYRAWHDFSHPQWVEIPLLFSRKVHLLEKDRMI